MATAKRSAGLLLFRRSPIGLEVFLVHPGGPFWEKKDLGVWTIPKGEYEDGEEPLEAARREFEEETSLRPEGKFRPLAPVTQKSGKVVMAWAVEGDFDPARLRSNTFEIGPPKSGRMRAFPEVDRAEWFDLVEARRRILPAQASFLDALAGCYNSADSSS
jgi:predicted NUDIX family NTP pyrophosphohydrolase